MSPESEKQEVLDDAPEELDGVQLERAALIAYSFIDIPKQDENQEKETAY